MTYPDCPNHLAAANTWLLYFLSTVYYKWHSYNSFQVLMFADICGRKQILVDSSLVCGSLSWGQISRKSKQEHRMPVSFSSKTAELTSLPSLCS